MAPVTFDSVGKVYGDVDAVQHFGRAEALAHAAQGDGGHLGSDQKGEGRLAAANVPVK